MHFGTRVLLLLSILQLTIGLMASPLALAQGSSNSTATDKRENQASEPPFTLATSVDYLTNLYKGNAFERQEELDYTFAPAYQINKRWSVSGIVEIDQDTRGTQDSVLKNTPVTLSYKQMERNFKNMNLTLVGGAIAALPTDQNSRTNETYNGGIGLTQGINLEFPHLMIPTTIGLAEVLKRNFHVYNQSADGSYNAQYSLKSLFSFTFQFLPKLSMVVSGMNAEVFSYNSEQLYAFTTDATIAWQFNKTFNVNAGVSNKGDTLQTTAEDSNFSFYKDDSAQVHIGIGVSL